MNFQITKDTPTFEVIEYGGRLETALLAGFSQKICDVAIPDILAHRILDKNWNAPKSTRDDIETKNRIIRKISLNLDPEAKRYDSALGAIEVLHNIKRTGGNYEITAKSPEDLRRATNALKTLSNLYPGMTTVRKTSETKAFVGNPAPFVKEKLNEEIQKRNKLENSAQRG